MAMMLHARWKSMWVYTSDEAAESAGTTMLLRDRRTLESSSVCSGGLSPAMRCTFWREPSDFSRRVSRAAPPRLRQPDALPDADLFDGTSTSAVALRQAAHGVVEGLVGHVLSDGCTMHVAKTIRLGPDVAASLRDLPAESFQPAKRTRSWVPAIVRADMARVKLFDTVDAAVANMGILPAVRRHRRRKFLPLYSVYTFVYLSSN